MAGYEKLSRVDMLFQGEIPWQDYEALRMELAAINTSMLDQSNIAANNINYTSYASATRKNSTLINSVKNLRKKFFYGIVVAIEDNGNNIYIDVPPFNNKNLVHIDNISKSTTKLEEYEDMIFFPASHFNISNPFIGGLARVMLPDNFPNHIEGNPQDAIYIEMVSQTPLVNSDRYATPAAPSFLNLVGVSSGGAGISIGGVGPIDYGELPEGATSYDGPLKGETKCLEAHYSWEYKEGPGPVHKIKIFNIGRPFGEIADVAGQEGAVRAYIAILTAYRTHTKTLSVEQLAELKKYDEKVLNPRINSAFGSYRTFAQQKATHDNYLRKKEAWINGGKTGKEPNVASAPGHSNHESGLAFDIMGTMNAGGTTKGAEGDSYFYEWMKINAPKFNLRRTDHGESWHWEWRPKWIDSDKPYFGFYSTPTEDKGCE
jgi:hypothetical protein